MRISFAFQRLQEELAATVAAVTLSHERNHVIETQLGHAHSELQTTHGALQYANSELKNANSELKQANEDAALLKRQVHIYDPISQPHFLPPVTPLVRSLNPPSLTPPPLPFLSFIHFSFPLLVSVGDYDPNIQRSPERKTPK